VTEHGPAERARKVAEWLPAILLAAWGLVVFDDVWYERIIYAVLYGIVTQVVFYFLYFFAAYVAAGALRKRPQMPELNTADYRVIGALLLAAGLLIWLQHSRRAFERALDRCFAQETRHSAFGQYDNAMDLLDGCKEEATPVSSFEDE
jgi:hypothetical protein